MYSYYGYERFRKCLNKFIKILNYQNYENESVVIWYKISIISFKWSKVITDDSLDVWNKKYKQTCSPNIHLKENVTHFFTHYHIKSKIQWIKVDKMYLR